MGGSGRGGGGKQHNEEMSLEDKWHASIGGFHYCYHRRNASLGRVVAGKLL